MWHQETAEIEPTTLTALLKTHTPFLRRDTLQRVTDLVSALIMARSTEHDQLALHLAGNSSLEAKNKRVKRCLQDQQLNDEFFLVFLISLLPPGKLIFTLDRTNWKHGTQALNLLVLGVVIAGFTLPLVWIALPHGGCSDSATRERLVARLLKHLPARRWKVLVADREFIGQGWFEFLRKRKIRRAIRIRMDSVVDELRVDTWFDDLELGQFRCLFERGYVYGQVMQVVATKSSAGDLVVIATDLHLWETWAVYKLRWSIECTFSSMKTRGFDLERSAMVIADRLERLFGLVTLAWVCCLRVGVWRNEQQPIKYKKHGRKAVSIVRYGWQLLAHALRWDTTQSETYFSLLLRPFSPPSAA